MIEEELSVAAAVVRLGRAPGGKTGLELTGLIKADASLSETKVILLTSKAQDADVRAGYAAGADLYLTKPFSPLEVLTAVEEAMASR